MNISLSGPTSGRPCPWRLSFWPIYHLISPSLHTRPQYWILPSRACRPRASRRGCNWACSILGSYPLWRPWGRCPCRRLPPCWLPLGRPPRLSWYSRDLSSWSVSWPSRGQTALLRFELTPWQSDHSPPASISHNWIFNITRNCSLRSSALWSFVML